MVVEVVFGDPQVPLKQAQKLLLHEVDFRQAEAEVVEASYGRITSPVLVLRRGVVEVLRGKDKSGEEDAVRGTSHTLGDRRQTLL